MVKLEYFNGDTWVSASENGFHIERFAWISLGGDDFNYRTVDMETGKVLTDKSNQTNKENDLIKEGRAVLKGVSDVPWKVGDTTTPSDRGYDKKFTTYSLDLPINIANHKTHYSCVELYSNEEDRNFIAWSRNNMEALLDKLEQLKEVNDHILKDNIDSLHILAENNDQHKRIIKLEKAVEAVKGKINSALICHPNAVKYLLDEALAELE